MRSSLNRRLRAIETRTGVGVKKHPMDMTDDELWVALDIRDPATGELRKDLTDAELDDRLRAVQARLRGPGQVAP